MLYLRSSDFNGVKEGQKKVNRSAQEGKEGRNSDSIEKRGSLGRGTS